MSEHERTIFDNYVTNYKKIHYSGIDDVKRAILRDLRYSKMQMINPELMLNIENQDADFDQDANEVYVFAAFMRPGKQFYSVCLSDAENDLQYFTHKMVVKKREEDIPLFVKEIKNRVIVRVFEKNNSVFKEWTEDGPNTALLCIENDLTLWHADKFIKDEEDLAATCDVMRKYASEIKAIFI